MMTTSRNWDFSETSFSTSTSKGDPLRKSPNISPSSRCHCVRLSLPSLIVRSCPGPRSIDLDVLVPLHLVQPRPRHAALAQDEARRGGLGEQGAEQHGAAGGIVAV